MQLQVLALFVFLVISIKSQSQSINYTRPKGYEENISKDDYKTLVDLSVAAITRKYAIEYVQEGNVRLKPNNDFSSMNLHNLIGKCTAVSDRARWFTVINDHFNSMFSSVNEQKQMNPNNFESIRKHLGIRIYTQATLQQRGGLNNLIARVDLEGTYTVLMLDLPSAFVPVSKQNASLWYKTDQELFETAFKNIGEVNVEKNTQAIKINGNELEVIFVANEDYAASYTLNLENNAPELIGEWGSVVVIPNKGIVAICKVSKSHPVDFVNFIQRLHATAERYYNQSDFPVSKHFFWYYKGKFTPIAVTSDADGSVKIVAPLALSGLMTTVK